MNVFIRSTLVISKMGILCNQQYFPEDWRCLVSVEEKITRRRRLVIRGGEPVISIWKCDE